MWSVPTKREEKRGHTLRSKSCFDLLLSIRSFSFRVLACACYYATGGTRRNREIREKIRTSALLLALSLSLSPSPSLYLGEDDRRVKEKRRRRRGARERVGCRWWGKKQKSSRSWNGPGWSQAIRDHPESRGVQLGSRQSGAVGMRPSGEKNKTNFYALVLPSPFFSAFSFAFAPLSLCLSLPSSSLALPLVVSRPPREKH